MQRAEVHIFEKLYVRVTMDLLRQRTAVQTTNGVKKNVGVRKSGDKVRAKCPLHSCFMVMLRCST